MEDRLLDIKESCEYLHLTRDGFYKLRKSFIDFPHPVKVGKKQLWRRSEIDEYLEKTREKEK